MAAKPFCHIEATESADQIGGFDLDGFAGAHHQTLATSLADAAMLNSGGALPVDGQIDQAISPNPAAHITIELRDQIGWAFRARCS
jgi:hypothetical protein